MGILLKSGLAWFSGTNMLSYLQRLKQRKIVQWAVAYAAVAWLSLEVFDLVAEQFFWPAWIGDTYRRIKRFGIQFVSTPSAVKAACSISFFEWIFNSDTVQARFKQIVLYW